MFALFYKHRSRDDLLDLVRGQFAVVAELPVIDIPTDTDKQVRVLHTHTSAHIAKKGATGRMY